MAAPRSLALVLSGGGARGAYEVGVLQYLADRMPQVLERVRVICGSSVGAVNGAFLAATGLERRGIAELAQMWSSLRMDQVLSVAKLNALRMLSSATPLRFLSGGAAAPASGLLDATGLWRIVASKTPWPKIHEHVISGRFDAVAITATDIACGEAHVFVDAAPRLGLTGEVAHDEFVLVPGELQFRHVLASAALPLLFPPVQISRRWYMDGGVRHNTPLSPALELGAEGLLIINVQDPDRADISLVHDFPGVAQMLGKLLDAIFHDRVGLDLDRLARINDIIDAVERLGPDAARAVREDLLARGRRPYRHVPFAYIHPQKDIGAMSVDILRTGATPSAFSSIRLLTSLFDDGDRGSGELSSFMLFDGPFTQRLIEMGYADAQARTGELAALL